MEWKMYEWFSGLKARQILEGTMYLPQTKSVHLLLDVVTDILFRSTPLRLIDGEHSSEATKDARNVNMRAVDDDEKKGLIGRKIDLIIKGSLVEMCSSE
ncbi:hypothetical protein PS15m_001665 [Mucor circinelloides]